MMEVEAKLRLADPAGLRARLAEAGATPLGRAAQHDVLFAHPCRDLAAADQAVRVRAQGGAWELTYKGPRQAGEVKARHEVNVPCSANPGPVLEALGFRPAVVVRKQRTSWALGFVTIAIDEVEGLGTFAEVEAMGDDVAAARGLVEEALQRLGIAGAPREARSYAELVAQAGPRA